MQLHSSSRTVRKLVLLAGSFGVAIPAALLLDRVHLLSDARPEEGESIPYVPPPMDPIPAGAPYHLTPDQVSRFYTHQFPGGTAARDFTLSSVDGHHHVHLSELHGKTPVVLLFGSYGCDAFCENLPRLTELHQK